MREEVRVTPPNPPRAGSRQPESVKGHESAATAPPWGDPKQARSYAALARRYLTTLPVVRIEGSGARPEARPDERAANLRSQGAM
jgi:hypothetical protein